jgi:ankyrin repeat protein
LQAWISAQQATQAAVVLTQEPQTTADAAGKRQSARAQADSGGHGAIVTEFANDASRVPDMLTAVMASDTGAVSYYLAQGVDINQTINGSTYLIGAVQVGDVEMVGFLLAQGADVNRGDRRGHTLIPPGLRSLKTSNGSGVS